MDEVRTIQLYAGRENGLPFLQLGKEPPLTLEFDLVESLPRPLSVYFYHANALWQRDLSPGEYLSSFHRDDLFDYEISTGTQVPYVHYTYEFPNASIGFQLSGNYIVRVAEQGAQDEVLFERPFYVAEDLGPLGMDLQRLLAGNQAASAIQPLVRFTPPPQLTGGIFDYRVCFLQNGRHSAPRCSPRPSLSMQPDLLFYLEPEQSFQAQEGDYYVDLRRLRPGGHIERIALSSSPFELVLRLDYARFPSSSVDPLLNGQAIISRASVSGADPDTRGEYVRARFSFVPPDETRLPGGVYIAGSFNGWRVDLGKELRWAADQGRYEGTLLLKQGEYEYRYTSPDPHTRQTLHAHLGRSDNLYTALVYYQDALYGTDRLLAYRHAVSQ